MKIKLCSKLTAIAVVGILSLSSQALADNWKTIADLSNPNRPTINFDKIDTDKCDYRLKQDFYFVASPGGQRSLDTSDIFSFEADIYYGPYIFPQHNERGLVFGASRERIVRSWSAERSEFLSGSNPDLSPNELIADRSTTPGRLSYIVSNRNGKSKLFFMGRYRTIEEVPNAAPTTARLQQVYELDSEAVVNLGEDSITFLLQESCSKKTLSIPTKHSARK